MKNKLIVLLPLSLAIIINLCSLLPVFFPQIQIFRTPTSTLTPSSTPTATFTPTQTKIPSPTPSPTPASMTLLDVIRNCEVLSQTDEKVIVSGKVFLPSFRIIGYTWFGKEWKGVHLKSFLETDSLTVTILLPVGEEANTIEPIPNPFMEKDLLIHDNAGKTIRHYHSVTVEGRVDFVSNEDGKRCQIWIDQILSTMPEEVLIPQELRISFLNSKTPKGTNCELLANQHQLVTIKGSLYSRVDPTKCNNVFCNLKIGDGSGILMIRLANREGPDSVVKTKAGSWQFFDHQNNPIQGNSFLLVGALRQTPEGCQLSVYELYNQR